MGGRRHFTIGDLTPGQFFTYRGPSRLGFGGGFAVGQVVGVESAIGIVHVSTFFDSPQDPNALDVEIGFLPILFSAFKKSVRELKEERQLPANRLSLVQSWRGRLAAGEAGAFSSELWKAEARVWETIHSTRPDASRETFFVEYAYPVADESGDLRSVEVSTFERAKGAAARA